MTRNFTTLTCSLFNDKSLLALALQDVLKHVLENEMKYQQCFQNQWWFGATFMDRIHVRVQMFLQSCATGDIKKLAFDTLDWSELLKQISLNEFVATTPTWLDISATKTRGIDDTSAGKNKRARTDNDRDKAYLLDWESGSRLQSDESYQRVFHVRNKLGTTPPLAANGTPLRHKCFATGQCLKGCRRSHGPLTEEERKTWRHFIDHCCKRYNEFRLNINRFSNLRINQDNNDSNQKHPKSPSMKQSRPPTPKHSPFYDPDTEANGKD